MASSSSSSIVPRQLKHDVFLSFRGEDTRGGFTSHLYAALCQKKILTFIDDDGLKRGEEISSALLKSIEESKISIIIFSKDYASSKWCLDELAKIIDCKKTYGQTVIPIFYHVDPSDVRKQAGSFGVALSEHENQFKDMPEKVKRWRNALTEASNLSGWDSSVISPESKLVERVVEDVSSKLTEMSTTSSGYKGLVAERLPLPPMDKIVGMDSKLSEVWRFIEDPSVGVIGLYGVGGVGKTTLLKILNNKFIDTGRDFEVVVWVTVSKEVNLEKMQEVLRLKLGIPKEIWKKKIDENGRAAEISKSLSCKKFVLLLDDVWEPIDLSRVGVPFPDERNGCKIVLTSRSEDVCSRMGVGDRNKFKVECLSPEDALELFCSIVTEDVLKSHHQITELAEIVAEECKGLPLALITIGSAMSNRRKPEEWRYAINTLKTNPSKFSGVENSLFPTLRFSYDSLSGDAVKKCFLYCSMFPEDHQIIKHELIDLWIAEEFLDNSGTLENARDEGEFIIDSLIFACLLERVADGKNHVKMHDVLRDMALWLATQEGNKMLVLENDRSIKKQGITAWQETVRITLWGSYIKDCSEIPIGPRLLSFVARDTDLEKFPSAFFESMEALKVLDLHHNRLLKKLPKVGKLISLQYLNLSELGIKMLPIEVKNFRKLRILLLDGTRNLEAIPEGVISSLSSLQVFSRLSTSLHPLQFQQFWDRDLLEELEQLDNIEEISVTLFTRDSLDKLNSSPKLRTCMKRLTVNCRKLVSLDITSPGYFQNLHDLCFHHCLVKDLTCLVHVPSLRWLFAYDCGLLEEIIASTYDLVSSEIEENRNVLKNLKILRLRDLPSLKSIYHQVMCNESVAGITAKPTNRVTQGAFPSLEGLIVANCPNLKKLPLKYGDGNDSARVLIWGEQRWWDNLEWEDEDSKNFFASKFINAWIFGVRPRYSYEQEITETPAIEALTLVCLQTTRDNSLAMGVTLLIAILLLDSLHNTEERSHDNMVKRFLIISPFHLRFSALLFKLLPFKECLGCQRPILEADGEQGTNHPAVRLFEDSIKRSGFKFLDH